MYKDIGSIFAISKENIQKDVESDFVVENKLLFSLCREALYSIATIYEKTKKIVLLPAYTCDTVIAPFRQLGWEYFFFSVDKNLRMNKDSFIDKINQKEPSLVVVHPYYGMDLLEEEIALLRYAKTKGADIIIDLTQSIYSRQKLDLVDFYVGSYRKWYPIPDGGFLFKNRGEQIIFEQYGENSVFVSAQLAAMILRQMYFDSRDEQIKIISRSLNKAADVYSEEKISSHLMSNISKNLLLEENDDYNQKQRLLNYKYLFDNIKQNANISFVCKDFSLVSSAPLYFPIFVKEREKLQKKLIENSVYAPILWPIEDDSVLVDSVVESLYKSILVIPIDQRYNMNDMHRIVNIINN